MENYLDIDILLLLYVTLTHTAPIVISGINHEQRANKTQLKQPCGNTSEPSCATETICVQGAVFLVNTADRIADGGERPYLRANLPNYTSSRGIHGRRTSEQQRPWPEPQH